MTIAEAPGKIILFGEHAVVYGRPAIAVPVREVRAQVHTTKGSPGQGIVIEAPDLGRCIQVQDAGEEDPLAHIVRSVLKATKQVRVPDLTLTVHSTVPMARGMGSGAAVSTAIVRALAHQLNHWLSSRAISELVYRTEVLYHGTPSGIDNTVIAYEKPVYFVKDEGWEMFWVGRPFRLAIADTGIESPTRIVVGDLGRRFASEPERLGLLFDHAGDIAVQARLAIERGDIPDLGRLMDKNHAVLQQMGVSCAELDRLVLAAREGGALGAKLSGAGWGGNMIALVTEDTQGRVDLALRLAGAANVIVTEVQ